MSDAESYGARSSRIPLRNGTYEHRAELPCMWCKQTILLRHTHRGAVEFEMRVEVNEDKGIVELCFVGADSGGFTKHAFVQHLCPLKAPQKESKLVPEFPEFFVEILAASIAREFKFIGGGEVTAHQEAWMTATRGILKKFFEQVAAEHMESYDEYELVLMDMVLRTCQLPDDLTRAEKLNVLIDQRNLYAELAKQSGTALEQIVKVRGLNETARMRDIAASALTKGREMLGG